VRPTENIIAYRLKKDATAAIDIGSIEIHNCDWYQKSPRRADRGPRASGSTGRFHDLTIANCTGIVDGISYTSASASDLWGIYLDNCSGTGSTDIPLTIDNFRLTVAGARSGSGVLTLGVLALANNTKASPLTLDGLWTKLSMTGMSAASVRAINLGISGSQCKVSGRISRVHVASPQRRHGNGCDQDRRHHRPFDSRSSRHSGLELRGAYIGADGDSVRDRPAPASVRLHERYALARLSPRFCGDVEPQLRVRHVHNRELATSTSAATRRRSTSRTAPALAITKIEASKDGTNYEEAWNQASGVMAQDVLVPVDNGDYIKVTFSTTQPTTRVRFRR
jgi:hypothetical protein